MRLGNVRLETANVNRLPPPQNTLSHNGLTPISKYSRFFAFHG